MITTTSGAISTTNATAVEIVGSSAASRTPLNMTLTEIDSRGGASGIDLLNGSGGTFSFGTGTSITNPTGTAFNLANSNANVTYSRSISDNSGFAVDIDNHEAGTVTFQTGSIISTAHGIRVQNSSGGTINFNNPAKTLSTGANAAVTLSSNTGGTISFGNGGLDIDTTSGVGFTASGGGTATASDDEIRAAQRELAEQGLYVEPTAVLAYAGWRRLLAEGSLRHGETNVVVLTGSGLKQGAA